MNLTNIQISFTNRIPKLRNSQLQVGLLSINYTNIILYNISIVFIVYKH